MGGDRQDRALPSFDIVAVGQAGRLTFEAVLLAASLRATNPDFAGRLLIAEPEPGPLWPDDPRIPAGAARDLLAALGAEIVPFVSRHFGASYPYGNKIECLAALPDAPFLFLDTDTLVTGRLETLDLDFARPSASLRREDTWPVPQLYGAGYEAIWRSLYDRFDLDFASSLDPSHPDDYWQRYLYFNAGWFFHRSPKVFGATFLRHALAIRDDPPDALAAQSLDPWLDQIALPLTIHALGGGRPGPGLAGLDGDVTCHWRLMPLLYARESDRTVAVLEDVARPNPVKAVLKEYEPFRRMIYQGRGARVRALFDQKNLPRREQVLRNRIKREGLWVR